MKLKLLNVVPIIVFNNRHVNMLVSCHVVSFPRCVTEVHWFYHLLRELKLENVENSSQISKFASYIDVMCQIFTLSAIPLGQMPMAVKECISVLKPGGLLLFRDYGN